MNWLARLILGDALERIEKAARLAGLAAQDAAASASMADSAAWNCELAETRMAAMRLIKPDSDY